MKRKPGLTLEGKRALWGMLFVCPWFIGFLLFSLGPLINSLRYSLSKVDITPQGLSIEYDGFQNYIGAFNRDPVFIERLLKSMTDMMFDLPLVVVFSMFIAVMLNRRFKGRGLVRATFFLPVVIMSGVVVQQMASVMASGTFMGEMSKSSMPVLDNFNIKALLGGELGQSKVIEFVVGILDRTMEIVWKSGVQILIFLAGLQTVSPSLYESAHVEGATGWESFWKITVPMVSPVILVNTLYTVISSYTDLKNGAPEGWTEGTLLYIKQVAFGKLQYGYSSALSWIYFITIFSSILIVSGILSRKVFYMND